MIQLIALFYDIWEQIQNNFLFIRKKTLCIKSAQGFATAVF